MCLFDTMLRSFEAKREWFIPWRHVKDFMLIGFFVEKDNGRERINNV